MINPGNFLMIPPQTATSRTWSENSHLHFILVPDNGIQIELIKENPQ
ncbi:hypothetical protein FM102_06820 [Corynebacterium glutamicum]|nr:hypothetical protein FM102_06820 [Corynebacterium glutamicum]